MWNFSLYEQPDETGASFVTEIETGVPHGSVADEAAATLESVGGVALQPRLVFVGGVIVGPASTVQVNVTSFSALSLHPLCSVAVTWKTWLLEQPLDTIASLVAVMVTAVPHGSEACDPATTLDVDGAVGLQPSEPFGTVRDGPGSVAQVNVTMQEAAWPQSFDAANVTD